MKENRASQNTVQGAKVRRKRNQFRVAVFVCAVTIAIFGLLAFKLDEASYRNVSPVEEVVVADAHKREDSDAISPTSAKVSTKEDSNLQRRPRATANGYTFVSHGSAETTENSLKNTERNVPHLEVDDLPSWMASSNAESAITDLSTQNERGWSFAWIWLSRATHRSKIKKSLTEEGAEIIGESGRLLRIKLPTDEKSVRRIANSSGVVRLAVMPEEAKLRGFQTLPSDRDGLIHVLVTLMEDEVGDTWRRELLALGAVVGTYDSDIRVYAIHATADVVKALARADFVLAVEPMLAVELQLDTLVPAMGADALRTSTGPGKFIGVGGSAVPIGIADSGLNIRHTDIVNNRSSLCGANFAIDKDRESDRDLWVDKSGHGTHVLGTMIANGSADVAFAGVAPSVQHVRFAKVIHEGTAKTIDVLRAMDYLATESACNGSEKIRPYIVNLSLGANGSYFEGRDISARKLDAIVWNHRQLYVVSHANYGASAFSNYGAAKNSLAVGATFDSGDIATFSSHGPTADGRLAPNIVAPGVGVCSTRGNGSVSGYVCNDGTSFASPAVAGIAALLMDAAPDTRMQPALVRARMMASAIRPNAWLQASSEFALDNNKGPGPLQARYGLGKASARTLVFERNTVDGWIGGGVNVEIPNETTYAYKDIHVPQGATRLDVVLTWDEPAVDPVAGPVLNDFDLWLDAGTDCQDARCGEHSSTSQIDNVEWVMIQDPVPGTWRLKVVSNRIHTKSKAAIAWNVIRGASTPSLGINVATGSSRRGLNNSDAHFSFTIDVDSYIAAGTALHFECRGAIEDCDSLRIVAADITRQDGININAPKDESDTGDAHVPLGRRIALGELAAGESTKVDVAVTYPGSSSVEIYYTASSWNAFGVAGKLVIQPNGGSQLNRPFDRPSNDEFSKAALIEDQSGSMMVDLAGATSEPGEPSASVLEGLDGGLSAQRPLGSLWYRWQAPFEGLTTFWLSSEGGSSSETITVFEGSALVALNIAASNQWIERTTKTLHTVSAAAFFAKRGKDYYVRIANSVRSQGPLTMHWGQGEVPVNDDFGAAIELSGMDGERYGTNAGATLEKGESFGSLAATTWYRWTAPRDGAWTFETDAADLRVGVFIGEAVHNLRLVSGIPQRSVRLKAQSGNVYQIAVSTANAYVPGVPYRFAWSATEWTPVENDDFEIRASFDGESNVAAWKIGQATTVEPGEPIQTGVRTVWWKWTARATREYTWRFDTTSSPGLKMTVFKGSELRNLQLVETTARLVNSREFSFSAETDTEYVFSLGWTAGDSSSYLVGSANGFVSWGPTPQNDRQELAIALTGTRGITKADDQFATTALDEFKDGLGHSSLWWTWEAPTPGWYTFRSQDRHVVIYRLDSGEMLPQGQFDRGATVFLAETGVRYAVRTTARDTGEGSEYRFDWAPTNAPAWLRYKGSISTDTNGLLLANPTELASGDDDTLFVISNYGLHIYQHNENDLLTARQSIDTDLSGSVLAWDATRKRLLVNRCGDWSTFERSGSIFVETNFEVSGDTANCGVKLLATADGRTVYRAGDAGLETFMVDSEGNLRYMDTPVGKQKGVRDTVLTSDGLSLYITTQSTVDSSMSILQGFARNISDGALQEIAETSLPGRRTLATDTAGRLLFAADMTSDVYIYELPALAYVEAVSYDSVFTDYYHHTPFKLAGGRPFAATADVIGSSVSLSLVAGTGITDVLSGVDRFGNTVPRFGIPKDVATSNDGIRIYASTAEHGILVFERIGSGVDPVDDFIRLENLNVSPGTIEFGETVSNGCIPSVDVEHEGVIYTVRNASWQWRSNSDWPWSEVSRNPSRSELCAYTPTTPGHYRLVIEVEVDGHTRRHSSNTLVQDDHGDSIDDASYIAVPSVTEGWLGPAESDYFRLQLNAPVSLLTLYSEGWSDTFGELFDSSGTVVAQDDDGGVNLNFRISLPLDAGTYTLEVSGRGGYTLHATVERKDPKPDLVISSAEITEGPITGEDSKIEITVQNNGNVIANESILRYYRSIDSDISVMDEEIGFVEVPSLSFREFFEHSIETDIVLDGSYRYGACVDIVEDEINTANNCATATLRVAEFKLDAMNTTPSAIAYTDGLLYITDLNALNVFVYTTAGVRLATKDFPINKYPSGLTYAEGLLYATHHTGSINEVVAYTTQGKLREDAGFFVDESNVAPTGITFAKGVLYVLDYAATTNGKVFAYSTRGDRVPTSDFEFEELGDEAIAIAEGVLWVSTTRSEWIHAYSLKGERQPNLDFQRRSANTSAGVQGMTYGDGSFYIVDSKSLRVYVY